MIKKIISLFVSFAVLLTIASASFAANSIDEAKKELQETQKERNAIVKQLKEAKKNLFNDKKVRQEIISNLQKKGYEKGQIEKKIQDIEGAITTLNDSIKKAQDEYDAQLKLFQERVVVLYIQSKTNANETELLQSESFDAIFKKHHMLQLVSKFDQDLMNSIKVKQEEIDNLKRIKEQEEDNAQEQLESMLQKINDLEVSRSAQEERIAKGQKDVVKLEKAENELEKESQEITKLIKKLSSTGKFSGSMQWPLPGYYKVNPGGMFGYRMHPILGYRKFHGGIDIGAPSGAYIEAAASGKVIWAGWRSGGCGNTVIIDHGGGISTLYLHIKNGGILVSEGQSVKAGTKIAKVGSTGLSTGPHLHFEVRKNGERQNPFKYVSNK